MPIAPAPVTPTADIVVARSARVLWRAGAFGVVVLGSDATTPIVLEGTGVALWDELDRARSVTDIVEHLGARYGVDPARVARDIAPVLDALLAAGACETVG